MIPLNYFSIKSAVTDKKAITERKPKTQLIPTSNNKRYQTSNKLGNIYNRSCVEPEI